MTTKSCPHVATCPMFELLTLSGTLKVWQERYCHADYEQCSRHTLSAEGKTVPRNLMPNGVLLRLAQRGGSPH